MDQVANILIVDDEEEIRFLLSELLCDEYDVRVAGNVEEAVEVLKEYIPDVLVTDIKMPGMDGNTFAEIIHQLHPEVSTILITGYHTIPITNKDGAFNVLYKPFSGVEFKNAIREVLEDRKKYQEESPDQA